MIFSLLAVVDLKFTRPWPLYVRFSKLGGVNFYKMGLMNLVTISDTYIKQMLGMSSY